MGFTLIELTVVLAVIVTLALVLTPSIANSINEARVARARNDCQTIASGMYQFYRDTGFFPLWTISQNGGQGTPANRVQILVSQGNVPFEDVPSLCSSRWRVSCQDSRWLRRPSSVSSVAQTVPLRSSRSAQSSLSIR